MDTDYPEARERWTLRNQVMDDNKTDFVTFKGSKPWYVFFNIFRSSPYTIQYVILAF